MKTLGVYVSRILRLVWILALLTLPKAGYADQSWNVVAGAQTPDGAKQAMAYLPNELWIHVGDSITWTAESGENHTVTFLRQPVEPAAPAALLLGQNRPSTAQGCSVIPAAPNVPPLSATTTGETAVTTSGTSYNPTAPNDIDGGASNPNTENCVNSGPICDVTLQQVPNPTKCPTGPTYTVKFVTPGNFRLVCLIHRDMTGVVHVLDPLVSPNLPHNQDFYTAQGTAKANEIIGDAAALESANIPTGNANSVMTTGELLATGGGKSYLAIVRYLPGTITVPVGSTVTWTNDDPTEPHTITFDPLGPSDPKGTPATGTGVSDPDKDNDIHGTLPNGVQCNASEPVQYCFNAGVIGAALQDQTNLPQPAAARTSVQVTFTVAGEYDYFCTIHPELGMLGKVIVLGNTPLLVTPGLLPNGTVGQPYSQQLVATGGTPPYNWEVIGGAIPSGFTLSASGLLTGTTAFSFANNFYVRVTDLGGNSITPTGHYSLTIQ
jgi:plastocyanin